MMTIVTLINYDLCSPIDPPERYNFCKYSDDFTYISAIKIHIVK